MNFGILIYDLVVGARHVSIASMKAPLLLALFGLATNFSAAQKTSDLGYLEDWGDLLQRFVVGAGVDYPAWHADPSSREQLERAIAEAGTIPLQDLTQEAAKAHLINVYNMNMVGIVLDRWPVESVATMLPDFGIFTAPLVPLDGGRLVSLDHVEKGLLLKEYFDPRIHFAVNCASTSCPPLAREPFSPVPEELEKQLETVTRAFLNGPHAARVNPMKNSVALSSLFDWYARDFAPDPLQYLNQYREPTVPAHYKLTFQRYDWSLNLPTPSES
ncbi:MAG: DUF547 domain-containing protein [Puniceicoccaceae bacterium]